MTTATRLTLTGCAVDTFEDGSARLTIGPVVIVMERIEDDPKAAQEAGF